MTVAVIASAVGLVACGGADPPDVEPETISKDEYVRRADVICTDIRRRIRPLAKGRSKKFVVIYREANARARLDQEKLVLLRDIDQPDRGADALGSYLKDVEAVAIAERNVAAAAVTRNLDVVRSQEKGRDEAADRETASARAFGFRVCGLERVAR